MWALVALRAVAFHLAVRAGGARRAVLLQLAMGAPVAFYAVLLHLAVRTRIARRALAFLIAVRAPLSTHGVKHTPPPGDPRISHRQRAPQLWQTNWNLFDFDICIIGRHAPHRLALGRELLGATRVVGVQHTTRGIIAYIVSNRGKPTFGASL